MNNIGFMSGGGPGLRKSPAGGVSAEGPDKIDMSLDDIIRLNRREQRPVTGNRKARVNGSFPQGRSVGSWAGGPSQRGGGVARLGVRSHRRGQGVITGLAARRSATLRKGISPLLRPALTQKPRPLLQRRPVQHRLAYSQRGQSAAMRRPVQLRRRNPRGPPRPEGRSAGHLPLPQGPEGPDPCAGPQTPGPRGVQDAPVAHFDNKQRTPDHFHRQSNGQNAARAPEPGHCTPHHPPLAVKQEEQERKAPRGVALEFDINGVGKQTALTLNERFRILKDRREASAPGSEAGRFVTVG